MIVYAPRSRLDEIRRLRLGLALEGAVGTVRQGDEVAVVEEQRGEGAFVSLPVHVSIERRLTDAAPSVRVSCRHPVTDTEYVGVVRVSDSLGENGTQWKTIVCTDDGNALIGELLIPCVGDQRGVLEVRAGDGRVFRCSSESEGANFVRVRVDLPRDVVSDGMTGDVILRSVSPSREIAELPVRLVRRVAAAEFARSEGH
jgi:hypothetical protein